MTGARRDDGTILILSLILTVVLAVIVIAIAGFVTVGLKTSRVTDHRNETNADGAAVITWAMEEFRAGTFDLTSCGPNPGLDIPVPGVIAVNGATTTLRCETTTAAGSFPIVYLRATASDGGTTRSVEAVAQFAPGVAVRTLDWRVDDSDLVGP